VFKIKLLQNGTNLSSDEIMQRIDIYLKEIELEQLRERVSFLKSDLPRLEASYKRLTQLIREAEEDYEWMAKRIVELEENNKRLREALMQRGKQ
jgi:shikimate kinase